MVAFHVRNGGETSADFSLATLSDDPDGLFDRGLVIIHARLDGQAWISVHDLDTDYRLSTEACRSRVVAPSRCGSVPDAGNETQHLLLPLDFRLRLTDATVRQDGGTTGGATTGGGSTTPDGVLPATGAPEVRASLLEPPRWSAPACTRPRRATPRGRRGRDLSCDCLSPAVPGTFPCDPVGAIPCRPGTGRPRRAARGQHHGLLVVEGRDHPRPRRRRSFDLKVNGGDALVEAGLRVDAMVPGSSTAAVFTVSNASVADHATMLYTIAATAVDGSPAGSTAALTAKVTTDSATTTTGSGLTCAGTGIQTGTSFNGVLVGTPRTLVPGASQKICIQATLAPSAPASGSSTITVTFRAVQKDPQTP